MDPNQSTIDEFERLVGYTAELSALWTRPSRLTALLQWLAVHTSRLHREENSDTVGRYGLAPAFMVHTAICWCGAEARYGSQGIADRCEFHKRQGVIIGPCTIRFSYEILNYMADIGHPTSQPLFLGFHADMVARGRDRIIRSLHPTIRPYADRLLPRRSLTLSTHREYAEYQAQQIAMYGGYHVLQNRLIDTYGQSPAYHAESPGDRDDSDARYSTSSHLANSHSANSHSANSHSDWFSDLPAPTSQENLIYREPPPALAGSRAREPPLRAQRDWSPAERPSVRRDRSPVQSERQSIRRDRSPVHSERQSIRWDRTPVRRDRSPHRNRSPVRRDRSPVRRDRSPVRRDRSPVRRDRSPVRRDRTPVRDRSQYRSQDRSQVRSPPQEQSPVRQEQSPVRQERAPPREQLSAALAMTEARLAATEMKLAAAIARFESTETALKIKPEPADPREN